MTVGPPVLLAGPQVFAAALALLGQGRHVMIIEERLSVSQEIALKDEAARHGVMVLGPGCELAVVSGQPLGKVGTIQPGRIGLVSTSASGARQVLDLLATAGEGVSHLLGIGSRDLSPQVSGRSALQALAALDADPETEIIMVVSEPLSAEVAGLIREASRRLSTPVLPAQPGAYDLAVEQALRL